MAHKILPQVILSTVAGQSFDTARRPDGQPYATWADWYTTHQEEIPEGERTDPKRVYRTPQQRHAAILAKGPFVEATLGGARARFAYTTGNDLARWIKANQLPKAPTPKPAKPVKVAKPARKAPPKPTAPAALDPKRWPALTAFDRVWNETGDALLCLTPVDVIAA